MQWWNRLREEISNRNSDKIAEPELVTGACCGLAGDVDCNEMARRFAFTGAEIKATIIGAATKRALPFEGERAVTMADMITAAERVERNQEPGRPRTVGF